MEIALAVVLALLITIVTTFLAPLLICMAIVGWVRRRAGGVLAGTVAATLLCAWLLSPVPRFYAYVTYLAVPSARIPLAILDLTASRVAREEVVRMAAAGALERSERGGFVLPPGASGLSVHGTVERIEDDCGVRVFFLTITGFSPDPYAGFEFVPDRCDPELDPLGSGHGQATPLGDGWFWIEAR